MENLYPAGPENVPAELTQPSKVYKRQAWIAGASLATFVVLYFALAGWFVWTAWRLFDATMQGGDTVLFFFIGLAAAFLALFMLKALFFVKRGEAPNLVEIKPTEQPHLFEFLHQLADDAGAPRPAKVYASANVNAAVFYDLSLLNLIFPSRKNLEIGLGLVNVLTLSEMKAVLAHEFGHFAQRSMAIGTWVYIAQQIAGQVIARRDALDKFLQGLSRIDVRIAWIGWGLSIIVWSIRSLLDTVFRLVVLAQRALSRQMEFQADLVAVSLTGSDELVHALHKLQAADQAWDRTLNFANTELRAGRSIQDVFAVHSRIIEKLSVILADPAYGKVPAAPGDKAAHRVFKASFARPPQMWSTHPANTDREENAKRQYWPATHDPRSAWLLFDNAESVKSAVVAHMYRETESQPASHEHTHAALDEYYGLLQYRPEYCGAYLGRHIARHATEATELYEASLNQQDVVQALSTLYPAKLSADLKRLQQLEEELGTLKALRDKVFQATGGQIVFRGVSITRRMLPAIITKVTTETETVRARILDHDRQCRSTHLAAATQLGMGWREYLIGLINVLHYGEHTLANVRDAHGLLGNVVAVVTADGKVTAAELKRLLATCNMLHTQLHTIYQHADQLQLDSALCKRLELESWPKVLGDFNLPPANNNNINDWMRVIDGWVHSFTGPLANLCNAALEQLLLTESDLAHHLREGLPSAEAPAPSRVPAQYSTLRPGEERQRQKKLDLWSRFMTADGFVAASARLLVAGGIVGTVLGVGGSTGISETIHVYNGLATAVEVQIGDQHVLIQPFNAVRMEAELNDKSRVVSKAAGKDVIEDFKPEMYGVGQPYVYNIASASPLVEWSAKYGPVPEKPPALLGAPRWTLAEADVYFAEPPSQIETHHGEGGYRTVLDGLPPKADPEKAVELVKNAEQRHQLILAHAQWDPDGSAHKAQWQALAQQENSSVK